MEARIRIVYGSGNERERRSDESKVISVFNRQSRKKKGVLTIHDDILIFGEGSTVEEARTDHDNNFHSLIRRCREKNIKLNQEKVNLRRKVPFMGHVISEKGVQADPAKVKAVLEMPTPTDVAIVRRFIGFTNYLSKFLPQLSDALEPLRKLTSPDVEWFWTDIHDSAVRQVKLPVTKAPVSNFLTQQRASPYSAMHQIKD